MELEFIRNRCSNFRFFQISLPSSSLDLNFLSNRDLQHRSFRDPQLTYCYGMDSLSGKLQSKVEQVVICQEMEYICNTKIASPEIFLDIQLSLRFFPYFASNMDRVSVLYLYISSSFSVLTR